MSLTKANDNSASPLACTMLERDAECPRLVVVAFTRPPTDAELAQLAAALTALAGRL